MYSEDLLGYTLQPLHHTEHDAHGDEADGSEDCPALPDRPSLVHERANPEQHIAYGRSTQPEALAETQQVLGSHLGYKGETQRRDEELGYGEEEIDHNQHKPAGLGLNLLLNRQLLESIGRRIAVHDREDNQEDKGQ